MYRSKKNNCLENINNARCVTTNCKDGGADTVCFSRVFFSPDMDFRTPQYN